MSSVSLSLPSVNKCFQYISLRKTALVLSFTVSPFIYLRGNIRVYFSPVLK